MSRASFADSRQGEVKVYVYHERRTDVGSSQDGLSINISNNHKAECEL